LINPDYEQNLLDLSTIEIEKQKSSLMPKF
jgi:hypothetical protein